MQVQRLMEGITAQPSGSAESGVAPAATTCEHYPQPAARAEQRQQRRGDEEHAAASAGSRGRPDPAADSYVGSSECSGRRASPAAKSPVCYCESEVDQSGFI